jgi:hypothetical protein
MDAIQRSKLGMGMTARDYLQPFAAITTPLPNYTTNFTIVQETIPQIQVIAEVQDFDKTGIRESKLQLRTTLWTLAADNSRKLSVFAKFTNNMVLLREIKISETNLKRLADADLKTKAQEIYNRAQENLESLAAYGITADTQTALQNAITAFNISIPKPRLGIEEKKQATIQLATLFKILDKALDDIDAAVEIVRLSQPAFYRGYKTARKVIITSAGSLSAKGFVTDAASGEGISGATLTFRLNGKIMLTKRTATKGGYNIKSLPEGVYNVTVSKIGCKEQVLTVAVTDGAMCELDVELEKS